MHPNKRPRLLSNVTTIDTQILALWYYWRWKIESFLKLLKQTGHLLENWQTSGLAIAKRLLVVNMACAVVWQLTVSPQSKAKEVQGFLIKLSGQ